MLSIDPALPMLRTLPKLRMLNKLLALNGPPRLLVLMGARLRLRLERLDLPMIDSSVLETSLLVNPSLERV
jgi:hypothetical protein